MSETEEGLRSLEELRPRLEQEDLDVRATFTLEIRFYHPEVKHESETSFRPQGSLFPLDQGYFVELGPPDGVNPNIIRLLPTSVTPLKKETSERRYAEVSFFKGVSNLGMSQRKFEHVDEAVLF